MKKNLLLLALAAFTLNAHAQLNKKWTTLQSVSGGIYESKAAKMYDGYLDGPYKIAVSNEYFEPTQDSIKGIVRSIDTAGTVQWTTAIPQVCSLMDLGYLEIDLAGIPAGNNLTATDATGNVATTTFLVVIVPYNVNSTTSRLIKIDSTGAIVWNVVVSSVNRISSWTVDTAGNTYLCGRTPEKTDSAGYKSNGIAIAKYNSTGALVWKKTKYTTGYRTAPSDIAIDNDGNTIVCGKKAAKLHQPFTEYETTFVTKYSNSGTALWTKEFAGAYDMTTATYSMTTATYSISDNAGDIWLADTKINNITHIPSVILRKAAKLTGAVQFTKTINNSELLGLQSTGQTTITDHATGMKAYNSSGTLLWYNSYVVRSGFIDVVGSDVLRLAKAGNDDNANLAWPDDWTMPWVIAKNVDANYPLDYFLVQLVDTTGAVLFKKNLSFGGSHDEYLGNYAGLVVDTASNVYLLINDNVPPYGTRVTKLSKCDGTSVVTGSLDPTRVSGTGCNNGKIKVAQTQQGTYNSWRHLELYNNSNILINAVDLAPATVTHTFLNLNSGNYTVKVFDESCGELNLTTTVECPNPVSSTFTNTNITSNSAKLDWADVSCDNGYRVQYRKNGVATWTYVNAATNTHTLNNLLPSTKYYWHVSSKCINSTPTVYSLSGQAHSFTTQPLRTEGEQQAAADYEAYTFEIAPNPVTDKMIISSPNEIGACVIKIFNAQGQLVLEKNINALHKNETTKIETASLNKGIYLFQIVSENGATAKRFIKQ